MNECCENLENRADGPGPRGAEEKEGLSVTHCKVCECRHFEAVLEPGQLGVKGSAL